MVFLGVVSLQTPLFSKEDFLQKSIAALSVHDYPQALSICEKAQKEFPESVKIMPLMIRILAESGQTDQGLSCLAEYAKDKDIKETFGLMESLAWSVLQKHRETSVMNKMASLWGACQTNDARATSFLLDAMYSTNVLLRANAVRLSARYNDKSLQKEVLRLLKEEQNWFVRMQAIQTAGNMQLKEAEDFLRRMIDSKFVQSEQRMNAIQALTHIKDSISREEIQNLLQSTHAGFRELGVQFIKQFDRTDLFKDLSGLLGDSSLSVLINTLYTLGTMGLNKSDLRSIENNLTFLAKEERKNVSLLAAWLLLQTDVENGRPFLEKALFSPNLDQKRFAASILGGASKMPPSRLEYLFEHIEDSFAKANFCMGLLKQRVLVDKASLYLEKFLQEQKNPIMLQPKSGFHLFLQIAPNMVSHSLDIPKYPQLVDQVSRLYLINLLSRVEFAGTKDLIKQFLRKHLWGITQIASQVLLQEDPIEAIEIVKELLNDENKEVRIQAALALAFYGKDPSCSKHLIDMYPQVSWEKKINIIEALGAVGDRNSIPFLLKEMKEPFHIAKTVCATSLIQCLYH